MTHLHRFPCYFSPAAYFDILPLKPVEGEKIRLERGVLIRLRGKSFFSYFAEKLNK
jgi:hypothetical protein